MQVIQRNLQSVDCNERFWDQARMNTAVTQVSKEMDSPAFWREQEMLLLENVSRCNGERRKRRDER
jgi:hypothetical protein